MATVDTTEKPVAGGLRTAFGFGGLIALIVGILILVWPGKTAVVVTAIIAIQFLVSGVVYVATGLFNRSRGGWARLGLLLLGVLYVVVGVAALREINQAAAFLAIFVALLVGITWIVEGFVALFTLVEAQSKVWTVIFAILSIVAGALLFVSPVWAAVTLWWLLGISLVVLGVAQIVRAITWKG